MWESLGSSYDLQGDGSAKFNGGTQQRLYTSPRLANTGDYVEFVVPAHANSYSELRATDTTTNAYIYVFLSGYFRNDTGSEDVFDSGYGFTLGDTIKFERGSGGTIKYYKNGVLKRTSTTTLTNDVQISFEWLYAEEDDIIAKPSSNLELNITTTTLPDGLTVATYSQSIIATGGSGSLTWSLDGGDLPDGLSLSSSGLISGTPTSTGTFSFTVKVIDATSAEDTQSLIIVITTPPPLPYGFIQDGIELFCEAQPMAQSNNSNVTSFTDISLFARHLTGASSYPTFQTNVINGKSVVRFSGSQNPLSVTASFKIRCGWIVAKYNGSSFSDYKGLLTDLTSQTIFTSNNSGSNFFNAGYDLFEFRSNDRIYPESSAPAPMDTFKLLFFRFWRTFEVSGIRLGQDRDFTGRKWNGDVPLVILCSRDFCESDIMARSAEIASAYGLTLADVFPYQANKFDSSEVSTQSVNIYDPPEGDRIAETLDDPKRLLQLNFPAPRRQSEVETMKTFHANHYPEVPFIYRNYKFIPPIDIEGYIDSPYSLDGWNNMFNYSFRFKEK